VAIVVVSLATQLVVPLVLLLLSVMFGRAMREAAQTVREAGKSAVENIHRSRRWLRGDLPVQEQAGERPPPAADRVDGEDQPQRDRVRVSEDASRGGDEDAAAEASEDVWDQPGRRVDR
jgi:hypothetical protein